MSKEESVTRWLREIESGDEDAASRLWQQYFEKLVAVARKELGSAPRRIADEEDAVLSVFRCLCDGATRGQFSNLMNRDQLWRLLVVMTTHKVIDQRRFATKQKRGAGHVRGESAFRVLGETRQPRSLEEIIAEDPTPDFLAMLAEEHQRLMDSLDDETLRKIAIWRMEGYTNEEVAQRLGLARRSVERKIQRIRQLWEIVEVEE